ncbi:phosphoribosylformylglycinamidine synthase I [Sulfurihydrogenibium azorense]|uniref:Phosphoribosylformylglycinamidine synthase subunit PurQ n=1 Tax=Sulfurihydrogenibium azorense (strain DSM 15241 / OCM 825 / Az-Fu1) TaxID=204536 RepID=C1DTR8_SULAA|nr:phosphoribosylformylglycinamidine synthase I [Sulfurihydrogenibium azorense]ACN99131.1 phosphoribosylformylglycinamidine synthase I [Sulfurihydrogenibium azorense Az-Fu1]MDM7273079.1 phosphoribosylformylglycinamidine synthase I [Sulfurihydrogenibium azorense]
MKFGVAVYPGSNCDYDTYYVIRDVLNKDVDFIDYRETKIDKYDCIIVPGGFSFGDYLRPGVIASHTPLTNALKEFVEKGKFVIGICNGFQILTEAHLLPGALLPNNHGKFICKHQYLKVENNNTPFTKKLNKEEIIKLPIAHHDGNYFVDDQSLKSMEEKGQIILRYCDKDGNVNEESNPNGSISNIAGVCNEKFNVFGLMPHPERACESILGTSDGLKIFLSIIN